MLHSLHHPCLKSEQGYLICKGAAAGFLERAELQRLYSEPLNAIYLWPKAAPVGIRGGLCEVVVQSECREELEAAKC